MRTLVLIVATLWASAPGLAVNGRAERIVIVADSRLFSGWKAWWANLYNDSHLLFALATIITIPVLALVLGRATAWILARTGIDLKSRQLAEH